MSKFFVPSTQAKDTELGTTENDRRGRTWVVTDVKGRGGGKRRIWKLQQSADGFVLVEGGGALTTSCVAIPEEVVLATEKQRQRERLGEKLETVKELLAEGAIVIGEGVVGAATQAQYLGTRVGGWFSTAARQCGKKLSEWREPPAEQFELISLAELESVGAQ